MNTAFRDDTVFPIINLSVPTDERLASMAEPFHWNGEVFTQYPFPVLAEKSISLLSLSCNALSESKAMTSPCDSIGDLSIRAIVFQDPETGNIYRRFLAHDRAYMDSAGRNGTFTDNKGNLTVMVNAEMGIASFRAKPSVIGVYFGGYRYDSNRRPRE